jgi:hypothetical protein
MQRIWNSARRPAVVQVMNRFLALAGLGLLIATAQAQTPKPQGSPPGAETLQGKDSGTPANSLSEQLSHSGGIITPPENVDRGIEAPTPDPGAHSMPVVPPPGAPGGDPNIKPK